MGWCEAPVAQCAHQSFVFIPTLTSEQSFVVVRMATDEYGRIKSEVVENQEATSESYLHVGPAGINQPAEMIKIRKDPICVHNWDGFLTKMLITLPVSMMVEMDRKSLNC